MPLLDYSACGVCSCSPHDNGYLVFCYSQLLVLPVVHTYNVQSNISFISRPRGEREKWGYSIEYVICFLVMQGARVEAGEAEGDKAVQR